MEIGPITEEGEYDDEYGGDQESNKWHMRLDFVGSERHYVKAVGFNNRLDELAGLLMIPYFQIVLLKSNYGHNMHPINTRRKIYSVQLQNFLNDALLFNN